MNDKKLADTIFAKYSARKKGAAPVQTSLRPLQRAFREGFTAKKEGGILRVVAEDLPSRYFAEKLFELVSQTDFLPFYEGSFAPKYPLRPLWIEREEDVRSLLGRCPLQLFSSWGYNALFLPLSLEGEEVDPFLRWSEPFRRAGGKIFLLRSFERPAKRKEWPVDGWLLRPSRQEELLLAGGDSSLTFAEEWGKKLLEIRDQCPEQLLWIDGSLWNELPFSIENLLCSLYRIEDPRILFLLPSRNAEGKKIPWKNLLSDRQSSFARIFPLYPLKSGVSTFGWDPTLKEIVEWAEWIPLGGWVTKISSFSPDHHAWRGSLWLSGHRQWFSLPGHLLVDLWNSF